jgi:hypothetical protein
MKYLITFSALFVFATLFGNIAAQNTSGLQFLTIGPNAHSLSISEAHTAVPLASNSLFTNPANLMLSDRSSLGASYTLWIGDTQNTQASAVILRENDAFAFGILSSLVDDISVRQTPGPSRGSFSVRYLALTAGYARQFGFLSAGISGSYIYEQFFQTDASGYAFTAGITGTFFEERLRAAAALTNAGRMQKLVNQRTELPVALRLGLDVNAIQISAFAGAEVPVVINFSADFVAPIDESFQGNAENLIESGDYLAFGTDIQLYDIISARAGYRTGNTTRNWSFGAGITIDPIVFNYAFIPFETGFGMVHSVSMQYFFDW